MQEQFAISMKKCRYFVWQHEGCDSVGDVVGDVVDDDEPEN